MCQKVIVADESHEGAVHMQISTLGIDIAKNVFQVHGVDAAEQVVLKKQLRRGQVLEFVGKLPTCLIGMEACATSHHWAREFRRLGHDVQLMPPGGVKAYVKRSKNDAADAAAICEAVRRPSMRFVPIVGSTRTRPTRATDGPGPAAAVPSSRAPTISDQSAIGITVRRPAQALFRHGVIPAARHIKALGISSPRKDEAHLMGPCKDGGPQCSTTSDPACR